MSSEEKTGDANNGDKSSVSEEESVDELSLLKKELEDMNDKLARSMADLDNFKKRIERDREQQNLKSRGLAVSTFLEVVEIIDKASNSDYPDLASAVEGINGIDKFTKSFLEEVKDVPHATDPAQSSKILRQLCKTELLKFTDMRDNPEKFFMAHRLLSTVGLGGFGIRFTVQFNLFAGSLVGLAGEEQLKMLDEIQKEGKLGCFLLIPAL